MFASPATVAGTGQEKLGAIHVLRIHKGMMKKIRNTWHTLLSATLLIFFAACSNGGIGSNNSGQAATNDTRARNEDFKLASGQPALDFVAKDLAGNKIRLSDYSGKVVLLYFWETSFAPCLEEIPNLQYIYRKYHDKGFDIIGINLDRKRRRLESVIKKGKIQWPQLFDGKEWENEIALMYRVESVPTILLLDRKGVIRYVDMSGRILERAVADLLGIPLSERRVDAARNVNIKEDAMPELLRAVVRSDVNALKTLLEKGADSNARDIFEWTALMIATEKTNAEMVDLLLEAGAEVNAKDDNGVTSLIVAAKEGDFPIVESLLARGAEVNARDEFGWTPLTYAAWQGHTEVVKLLISHGADVNAKDDAGRTALQWAQRENHSETVEELRKGTAKTETKDGPDKDALIEVAKRFQGVEKGKDNQEEETEPEKDIRRELPAGLRLSEKGLVAFVCNYYKDFNKDDYIDYPEEFVGLDREEFSPDEYISIVIAELATTTRVRLEVWDTNHNLIKSKDNIAPSNSYVWYIWEWFHPGELPPGDYIGLWIVGGDDDAAVRFRITPEDRQ